METCFIVQTLSAGFFRWHSVVVMEDGCTLTIAPMFGRRRARRAADRAAVAFLNGKNAWSSL